MRNGLPVTEADVLDELLTSRESALSRAEARSLLKLRFSRAATERIRKLLRKNNAGTIRSEERRALDNYLRVGQFLDLLHAKAHLTLSTGGKGH
jgi:hypothetical protein